MDKGFPNEYHKYENPSHSCSLCVIRAARKTDSITQFQFQWQCYSPGCGFLKYFFSTEASKKFLLYDEPAHTACRVVMNVVSGTALSKLQ